MSASSVEERGSDDRDVGEQRNADRGHGDHRLRFVRLADERRKPDAEDRQGEPRRDLVRHQRERQRREDEAHRRAGEHTRADPRPRVAGAVRDGEGRDRADGHDAFGPEVQHARLLGDELAQRRDDERRPRDDRREQHRGDDVVHRGPIAPPGASTGTG